VARYLLDTDVLIDVSRGSLKAAAYVDSLDDVSISIITAQELIVGARGKRDVATIESLISTHSIEHVDDAVGLRTSDTVILKETGFAASSITRRQAFSGKLCRKSSTTIIRSN
jgi:predicted nucleic acid-binding protein